ncbi:hypothetical protein IF2G_07071 [Cordyceps javanica]|nr:hypothetical protein IF2G_07071 [Cordyceps javanica]
MGNDKWKWEWDRDSLTRGIGMVSKRFRFSSHSGMDRNLRITCWFDSSVGSCQRDKKKGRIF